MNLILIYLITFINKKLSSKTSRYQELSTRYYYLNTYNLEIFKQLTNGRVQYRIVWSNS